MNTMQTKPLRSYGIDVTQSSLQPIVKELGITDSDGNVKSVKNMSQAEKEILRYIATLKQAKIAMGDLANTIESPSNQLKVFRQQLVETKVAFSSLFIGTLSKALPYANAFLMVIKETSKALATMFGIELKDYNAGIASQEGIYDGIADSADDASDAVKELKRQTLGFDEIHNINENKDSGTSASGGIDQRLLDAITGYDNGMDKVRMKATEIRDKWMEILGFTKNTNSETGEVYFTYGGLSKTIQGITKWWGKLNTESKLFIGLGIAIVFSKIYTSIKKVSTILGGTGLVKQFKNLNSYVGVYTKLSGNFVDGIVAGTNAFLKQKIVVTDSWGNIDKLKTSINGVITALGGMALAGTGIGFIKDSMNDIANGTSNLLTVIGLVGGTILTIGGALTTVSAIATVFGTTMSTSMALATGGISLVVGAVAGLIAYITTSKNKTSELTQEIEKLKSQSEEMAQSDLVQIEHTKNLSKELANLIDSNGRVKEGYEDRVNFILNQLNSAFGTEYELINGAIYNNGKLVESYDDVKNSIERVISSKKAEIILNAYENVYVKALENRKSKQDELNEKIKNENEELQKLEEQYKNGEINQETYMSRREEIHSKYEEQYRNMKKEIQEFQTEIDNYDKLLYASSTGNIDKINDALKEYISNSETVTSDYWKDLTKDSETAKNCIDKNLNSLNGRKITGIFDLQANTSGATKSLNEFGNKLNKSGFGTIWSGISFTPAYSNGGFPEDGFFFANHNELVGKFNNGKTAVANNGQIEAGIEEASYRGYMRAINDSGISGGHASEIDVHVHTDEGTIIDKIEQRTKQTGVFPFTIPTY